MATCKPASHDFEKFDEATIFCRRCGEQRVVDVAALIGQLPQPIYLPCPGPHWQVQPWTPVPLWYYNTNTTTAAAEIGTVAYIGSSSDQVTLT